MTIKYQDHFPNSHKEAPEFDDYKQCIEWIYNYGGCVAQARLKGKYEKPEGITHKYELPPTIEELPVVANPTLANTRLTLRTCKKTGDTLVYNLKTGKRCPLELVEQWAFPSPATKHRPRLLLVKDMKKIDGIVTQRAIQSELVEPALARLKQLIQSENEMVATKNVETVLKYAGIPKGELKVTHEASKSFAEVLRAAAKYHETREKRIMKDVEDAVYSEYEKDTRYIEAQDIDEEG